MDTTKPSTGVTTRFLNLLKFPAPRVTTVTDDQIERAERASSQMLVAIADTGKHFYQGTVPAHVKARRRAKNKAARKARRPHR